MSFPWRCACSQPPTERSALYALAVPTPDHTELLNGLRRGFDAQLGFRYTKVTLDEVEAELEIGPEHTQQYGLVHGGVYASLAETLCSAGAAINAMARGLKGAVGLENSTSFLRAVKGGSVRITAKPIVRGRRTQVWAAEVRDEAGRLLATSKVRLLCLAKDDAPAGEELELQVPERGI